MAACTFFGHRECPSEMEPKLREVLIDLITNHDVDMFYVGNQGQFDTLVRRVLQKLTKAYPHIHYAVVLAYMPGKQTKNDAFSDTMLPEGTEAVHPRYAISRRNDWLLKQSDFVVTYITHGWGGAARYATRAERAGKTILKLAGTKTNP